MAQPSKQQAASVLDSVAGWRPLLSTPQTKSPALGGARKGGSVMKQKASLTQIATKPRPSQQRSPAPMFQIGAVHQRSSWECSLSVNGRKSAHKNATNPNAIDATATARNIQTQRFMAAITFAGLVR